MSSRWKSEWKPLLLIIAGFAVLYFLPVQQARFEQAIMESIHLVKWYAREHVLLCLIPAFLIAGGISVFIGKASVMKYLGAEAPKVLAYGVASVSGTILAVCSCTVLPLFTGIYRMGAGLGPATAFLYSGPAINVLAIVLTARVLGWKLGLARALGAVIFSVLVGLLMHLLFRHEEKARSPTPADAFDSEEPRPLWQSAAFFAALVGILVFANWGQPDQDQGWWHTVYTIKWALTSLCGIGLGIMLVWLFKLKAWKVLLAALPVLLLGLLFPARPVITFTAAMIGLVLVAGTHRGEAGDWIFSSWGFMKQIMPLLLAGVLLAGLLLGRPGHEGLIPSQWISGLVGGNSLSANLFASLVGAFMYFATLTEVPILQGLIGSGMGQGPALALLLAGPALSLPNMLVIHGTLGFGKTLAFVAIVVVMATLSGLLFGALVS